MAQTFTVENYKGIVGEVSLSPNDSQLVVIAGANGAGKSSFLDAIRELIKYKGSKLIPQPIREGETEARAEFTDTDLGIRLERVWKLAADGSTKSTFNAYALDGARYGSAVEVVAELTGGGIIDPVEFVLLDEKKQRDVLLSKVDLPFDLEELGRQRTGAFEQRTNVNRQLRDLEGDLNGRVKPDAATAAEEVNAADIIAEIGKAQEHNRDIQRSADMAAELDRHIEGFERQIADMKSRLLLAEQDRIDVVDRRDAAIKVATASKPIDTDDLTERLSSVQDTNAAIREGQEYRRVAAELTARKAESDALTAKLEAIDKQKIDGLAKAVFPADGLSVTDEGVTVNGTPFVQLNDAQKIAVGFDIATHGNPKLKLIFIKFGDALDDSTLALIAARGQERGYTIVTERGRDNSSEIGFTFNEGNLS